ncbi:hypothetical protein [Pseudomonas baetica]|uniref:hypothetical protein n=1 Tax=Pseudomonas baetica TaxID=674054 RepID=UPI0024069CFC|nr:hypothetical protein [Pseudomonas baetica]MDF9779033.1 hypothetical protein [Pseudomonas baetica]
MDDIKRQTLKRFEQLANAAGWQAHLPPPNAAETTVPVWLYSVSPNSGPRFFSQLYLSAYRGGKLPFEIPKGPGFKPWDIYCRAIAEFDMEKNPARQIELHQQMVAVLLHYARNTQTWAALPPLDQVPGLHFVVFDWLDKKGVRQMRPMAVISAQPLSIEELSDMFVLVLDVHLARNPHEGPVYKDASSS